MKYEVYKVRNLTEEELKKENEKKEKAVKKNKEYYVKKKIRDKIQNISAFEWSDNKKDQFLSFNFTTDQKLAMPSAIGYLATAISKINTELLALKCNLAIGDYVTVASLEETDKYVLLDKVITKE